MAELPTAQQIKIEVCHAKVAECREYARMAKKPEHVVMFEHMAETWERIAADIEQWRKKH